jgi:hypothetical protein
MTHTLLVVYGPVCWLQLCAAELLFVLKISLKSNAATYQILLIFFVVRRSDVTYNPSNFLIIPNCQKYIYSQKYQITQIT